VQRKNRIFSGAEREAAIKEWQNGQTVVGLADLLGVHRNTITNWMRGKPRLPDPGGDGRMDVHNQRIEELLLQVAALEGTVGRQAMEIRFFKGALRRVEVSRQQKEKIGETASTPKSKA